MVVRNHPTAIRRGSHLSGVALIFLCAFGSIFLTLGAKAGILCFKSRAQRVDGCCGDVGTLFWVDHGTISQSYGLFLEEYQTTIPGSWLFS